MKLDVEYIDKPFHVVELPLTKVYVLDDYLETSIHHSINYTFTKSSIWAKGKFQGHGTKHFFIPHHCIVENITNQKNHKNL